jgi:hypothetical protein
MHVEADPQEDEADDRQQRDATLQDGEEATPSRAATLLQQQGDATMTSVNLDGEEDIELADRMDNVRLSGSGAAFSTTPREMKVHYNSASSNSGNDSFFSPSTTSTGKKQ